MSSYALPQVDVFKYTNSVPAALGNRPVTVICGPQYQLLRYAVASEKLAGYVTSYDPAGSCHAWPNLPDGATVDITSGYTKVFVDDAMLQYFYMPAVGVDTVKATYCDEPELWASSKIKNAVRALVINWKTSGDYARYADLRERDVTIGDGIRVAAVVGEEVVELVSTVTGFINEKISGTVGALYEDDNNVSTPMDESSLSSTDSAGTSTKVGFEDSDVDISSVVVPSDRLLSMFQDGVSEDTYTIEITDVGEISGVATAQVSSASGTDDDDEVAITDWDTDVAIGSRGVTVQFSNTGDEFEVGMKWTVAVQFDIVDVDATAAGEYEGATDTTYIVSVSRGGIVGDAEEDNQPQITVTTTDGSDYSGPHLVSALSTPISIGTHGVTVTFSAAISTDVGLYLGDKYYVDVVAPTQGAVRTMVLADDLPDELLGITDGVCGVAPALSVTLYIKKDMELSKNRTGYAPLTNWTESADELCLADGVVGYDSTWIDDGGTQLPMLLKGGDVYVQYRALLSTYATTMGTLTITGGDTVLAQVEDVLGTVSPSNPLALGVYLAALNANGNTVAFMGVASDDVAGYTALLRRLAIRNDVYALVPMSNDSAILDLFTAHVDDVSGETLYGDETRELDLSVDSGRWRRVFVSPEVSNITAVLTSASAQATITEDPDATGENTIVTLSTVDAGVNFESVRAGDTLRCNYSTDGFDNETYTEYTVEEVLSSGTLRLVSGPDTEVTVASRVSVYRTLTSDEWVTAIKAVQAAINDKRATMVWPDEVEVAGSTVDGFYFAAAIAGYTSGVLPHQGLTNAEIAGIDSVSKVMDNLSLAQIASLSSSGVTVGVSDSDGVVFCRQLVATDGSEEVSVRNTDNIAYALFGAIGPFFGTSNLTDTMYRQIATEITAAANLLIGDSFVPRLGSQLSSAYVSSIEKHPVLQNKAIIVVEVSMPEPFNSATLYLVG